MTNKLTVTLTLVLALVSPLAIGTGNAQTVAPGPYYAKPSWDQTLACSTSANCPRFIVLSNMNSEAVLDRDTGLVWERSPSATAFAFSDEQLFFSNQAALHCNFIAVGNRRGWRVPSIQELASLVDADPLNTNSPRLPPGHPFQNVPSDAVYWSANQFGLDSIVLGKFAWNVSLRNGLLNVEEAKQVHPVWCVRGGSSTEIQ